MAQGVESNTAPTLLNSSNTCAASEIEAIISQSLVEEDSYSGYYRDYSTKVPESNQVEENLKNFMNQSMQSLSQDNRLRRLKFPEKLHLVFLNPELEKYIQWLPHGRAFKVLNSKMFEKKVLPIYFEHNKYSSFMRCLHFWGFRRITYNQYYHEMFLRGMPGLSLCMKRLTRKDCDKRKLEDKEAVLKQFHQFSKNNPVGLKKSSTGTSTAAAVAATATVGGLLAPRYMQTTNLHNNNSIKEREARMSVRWNRKHKPGKFNKNKTEPIPASSPAQPGTSTSGISKEELTAVLAMKELFGANLV